jgi:uncharacterized protein
MTKHDAKYWIDHLELTPHPEGGYFKSTFHSDVTIPEQSGLSHGSNRLLYTSIYFLLGSEDISHFHRLKSDELWYFHAGSPLSVHVIDENGEYREMKLGLNIENGEQPQILVKKNTIFGSSVLEEDTFSLVGCMVSPGFDFVDFELFSQDELLKDYPQHEEIIRKMAYKTVQEE